MSEDWNEYAEGWDSNSDVITYSNKAFKSLSQVVDFHNLRVLDFGCGTGLLSEKISPLVKEVVALDTSKKMISVLNAKNLSNVTTICEELSQNLVKENNLFVEKFDLVLASSVCGFLPDFEKTLELIHSLLKPNGIFIQWDWLSTNEDDNFGFTKESIKSAYSKAGLVPMHINTPFSMANPEGELQVLMGVANKP